VTDIGISAFGVYLPRLRLERSAIACAHAWAFPGTRGKGTRAYGSFDEDSITMAVAAAREALRPGGTGASVETLLLASTTMPFLDRQNATVVGAALGLGADLHASDISGSQRAGTSALIHALRGAGSALVVAAERPLTRPGSAQEMLAGDGAAALRIGRDEVAARFLGAHSVSSDMLDHYRAAQAQFDYVLEERWVRDEGYLKVIPQAVQGLLGSLGLDAQGIDRLVMGGVQEGAAKLVAKQCGIRAEALQPGLIEHCGYLGCAYPLAMLCAALETAAPGEKILLLGFGQGCDALLFETTERILDTRSCHGMAAALASGRSDDNYLRFLSFNRLIDMDFGMREERDTRTAPAAHLRAGQTITAFVAGRCTECGAVQFPKTAICVNPQCNRHGTQVDESLRERIGHVKSFTEDWLALSRNPPLMYGNVRFGGKAVLMMEFTGFDPGQLAIGAAVRMEFRIKDFDKLRHFHRYFWKAAPATGAA
jgi:3-hydroxy-3-methylglutaryl CoA synthase